MITPSRAKNCWNYLDIEKNLIHEQPNVYWNCGQHRLFQRNCSNIKQDANTISSAINKSSIDLEA